MNIYAKFGDKVVFDKPNNGHARDRAMAAKYLKVGEIYTVEYTSVGGYYTEVHLQEFPKIFFNSVMFGEIKIP